MSIKETKFGIWLGVVLLAALLVLLLILKFIILPPPPPTLPPPGCPIHKDADPQCEDCFPRHPDSDDQEQPKVVVTEERIKESYKPDMLYVQTANVECVSRGTYKRWGIMTVQDTRFNSRMSIERQLIRQEGDTIVMQVRFAENFMVGIFTDVKEAKLNLSPNLQAVMNGLSGVLMLAGKPEIAIPLRWAPMAQKIVDRILGSDISKTLLGPVFSSKNAKMFNTFGELQGKKFEITWKQGKGVTDVKEIDCATNARERQYLYSLSIIPDVFMFPDFDKKPGEQWKVDAKDFVPFLDSSVNAKVTGGVTLQREDDEADDTADEKKAALSVVGGSFYFNRTHGKQGSKGFTFARWSPKGKCKYDFAKGIFTEGKLAGEMVMQNKGLDLFIFEMDHTERPEFQVQFVGEVRPIEGGDRP